MAARITTSTAVTTTAAATTTTVAPALAALDLGTLGGVALIVLVPVVVCALLTAA
eukprot:CAMPEP_0198345492 /NCGR_PEP_ID=MMETSP1450-20131203/74422_1 /TAXON_ID=753684 ORGANISM="Madagascaria erythrocladiodes, Strain CCMP3234" /NCGR_SAMPLE_ID=MMETSP1450 /ASSEMBLY_ACC=CAM_ASM_001115 /LENGTH=54 /DNA_ID=CAMNT_0044050841 /DNA_START=125 /DNA_END=286 /DNA_ORIENTATION=+